mmetsp:Transcript_4936/g.22099  ORF Transcript_4936/g.22099 Transcript_4936/m.22099 type:complete len:238 (+) Transcript_4936:1688-2401(+)
MSGAVVRAVAVVRLEPARARGTRRQLCPLRERGVDGDPRRLRICRQLAIRIRRLLRRPLRRSLRRPLRPRPRPPRRRVRQRVKPHERTVLAHRGEFPQRSHRRRLHSWRRLRHREPRAVLPPGPIDADGSKLERRRARCVRTGTHRGAFAVEDVLGPVRGHRRAFVGFRDVCQYSRHVARVPAQSRVVPIPNRRNLAPAAVLERDDRMRPVLVRPELLEPVHVSTRRVCPALGERVA